MGIALFTTGIAMLTMGIAMTIRLRAHLKLIELRNSKYSHGKYSHSKCGHSQSSTHLELVELEQLLARRDHLLLELGRAVGGLEPTDRIDAGDQLGVPCSKRRLRVGARAGVGLRNRLGLRARARLRLTEGQGQLGGR
eukprot:scaffold132448_cov63-Phaeocystis_antarctica.AAC.1